MALLMSSVYQTRLCIILAEGQPGTKADDSSPQFPLCRSVSDMPKQPRRRCPIVSFIDA